ncbi:MAG: DUF2703 domain-containing protein [Eubacteriaceae bacterium]
MSDQSQCCSCGNDCCGTSIEKRKLVIDFLFLDLSVCTRCQGTENSLEESLDEVAKVLQAADIEVRLNKVNVNTKELAEQYKFISSPTIRINGKDIQMDVKESICESCGDLCGDEVNCRVWLYNGQEYTIPPKAMIIEAILKNVYGANCDEDIIDQDYVMPENLVHFYNVTANKNKINLKEDIKMKTLKIEWRHLDIEGETCDRCYDTGENLEQEVKRLNRALKPKGITVEWSEIKLDDTKIPQSNTVFFNGAAIEDVLDIKISENYCQSCTDLLGKKTYCRTILFEGEEYEDIPAKAIRKAAYKVLGIDDEKSEKSEDSDCGCGCSGGCC